MEKWKKLCEKIGKDRIWICIIGGLLLLVVTYPLPSEKQENYTIIGENVEKEEDEQSDIGKSKETSNAYGTATEQRLSSILSQMDGAGEVKVFVTFSDYGSHVVEKDTTSESSETTVYTVGEDGNEVPFVQKVTVPKVEGVLVLTQGGNNPEMIREMKEAIMALFGIEEHKIKIAKMKGEER